MLSDAQIRLAAFNWLDHQTSLTGEVLDFKTLQAGFKLEGIKISLASMQGIFKPAVMDLPLSIRTSFGGPYRDSFGQDGLLKYKYRGTDPNHPENVGLRTLLKNRIPLAYLHGVAEGQYLAAWPVYVVGDDLRNLTFTIAVDESATIDLALGESPRQTTPDSETTFARRVYKTQEVKRRLHQQGFRMRVLKAYRNACSFCQLRHQELLDAAHIIPDSDPEGEPEVSNGLALCKIHHAAFDRFIVGVNPDCVIHVRKDVLEEVDGPMLRHGLQALDGQRIHEPHSIELKPDRKLLEIRYSRFLNARSI